MPFADTPLTSNVREAAERNWSTNLNGPAVRLYGGEESAAFRAGDVVIRIGPAWRQLAELEWCHAVATAARFTNLTGRRSLRGIGDPAWSAFEAHLTCTAGSTIADALILTGWHVTDAAKTTTIRYQSGTKLVMDHTAGGGYLLAGHHVSDLYGTDASIPRRERHYRALYQSWLTDSLRGVRSLHTL